MIFLKIRLNEKEGSRKLLHISIGINNSRNVFKNEAYLLKEWKSMILACLIDNKY